jgi:hypothetical protein
MWADTLLALERGHLVRLGLWGAGCVLLGTLLIALLVWRRNDAAFLRHFAIQTAAWGAVDLLLCAWAWRGLSLRTLRRAATAIFCSTPVWMRGGHVGDNTGRNSWRISLRPGGTGPVSACPARTDPAARYPPDRSYRPGPLNRVIRAVGHGCHVFWSPDGTGHPDLRHADRVAYQQLLEMQAAAEGPTIPSPAWRRPAPCCTMLAHL